MAIRHTADIDGVGHSRLLNWLMGTELNEDLEPALLGHLYFDVGPSNFFGGRGALSIRDNRGTGFFSRLAPGEVGSTTSPPDDSDRTVTDNDGTAPIRFDGNTINARSNWAKLLDVAQDIQLKGKAEGRINTPTDSLFRGDAAAVVTVTKLSLDTTGTDPDSILLAQDHLLVGNNLGVAVPQPFTFFKLNNWGKGELDMGNFKITNLATPTEPLDAANKKYVDDNASGIQVRDAVRLATESALPPNIAVLTNVLEANSNGALTVDGLPVVLGDRLLIKDEANKVLNGIYDVTVVGDTATPWRLTRSADSDTTPELQPGMYYTVSEGIENGGTSWVQSSPKPFTLNTHDCLFSKFSTSAGILAGKGIFVDGKTVHFLRKDPPWVAGQVPFAITSPTDHMEFSNVGLSGQPFLSRGGSGTAPEFGKLNVGSDDAVTGTLRVDNGGTGRGTLTAYNVLIGNGTTAVALAAPGNADYALVSNGPAAMPSFRQMNLGTSSAFTGVMPVERGGTERSSLTLNSVLVGNNVDPILSVGPHATVNVPLCSMGLASPPAFTAIDLNGPGVTGILPVERGGTELPSLTLYSVMAGNGVNPVAFIAPSTIDHVLTSNGPTAFPSFRPINVSAVVGAVRKATGTINAGATGGSVTHGWNTNNVEVYVSRAVFPFDEVLCDVRMVNTNAVTVTIEDTLPHALNITVLG